MSHGVHLTTWVSRESKARFAVLAKAQGLSESALLRRAVEATLSTIAGPALLPPPPIEPISAGNRISVRLRREDLLLPRERARGRQMPTSTYVSLLVRSHLPSLAPLPTVELEALRRALLEVGAIGRNLNQIARAVNEGQWPHGPNRNDLVAMIDAIARLKDSFRAVIETNLGSWDAGHATV